MIQHTTQSPQNQTQAKTPRPEQQPLPPLPIFAPVRPAVQRQTPPPNPNHSRQTAWQAIQRRLTRPVIQRDIPYEEYDGDHAGAAESYAKALDKAVQKAWAAVQSTPLLGKLADYDGHTQLWAEKMADFAKTGSDPGGLHTSFGYVIESLATGPLKPDPPSGYHILLQGSRGGTRPDVILRHGFLDAAWLDITASNSQGHIFNKEGGWQQVSNFAEITYPSVDVSEMIKMKNKVAKTAGDELDLGVDPNKILQEKIAAQKALVEKRQKWQRIGNKWLAPVKKISQSKWPNADEMRATLAKQLLAKNLEIEDELDNRTAASIINAMNLLPTTYGFRTGVSVSTGTGISILQDIDPEEEIVRGPSPKEKMEQRKKDYKSKDFALSKEKRKEQDEQQKKAKKREELDKRRGITQNKGMDSSDDDSSSDDL